MSILRWIGMVANYGDWLAQGDTNHFKIPVVEGKQRARKLEPEFRKAVVEMGASGDLFTSNAHCVKVMRKFQLARGMRAFKKANAWNDASMARYLCGARRALQGPQGRVISLAWDGTRLSGMEFLFSVMHANAKACVCPPMVPRRCGISTCNISLSKIQIVTFSHANIVACFDCFQVIVCMQIGVSNCKFASLLC